VIEMAVLVAYASRHSSTMGIAERIAARLRQRGHDVDVRSVEEVGDIEPYEAIVLGSAIYYGRWLQPASEFVRRQRAALAERPVWLFSSGPLGTRPGEEPAQVGAMREAIGPRGHRVFFGALDRGRLGFAERLVVRAVRAPDGDFRRWDEIDDWADMIASQLGSRLPVLASEVAMP
jgi:menaquinone-dependent protoporphyrinogen oxidase